MLEKESSYEKCGVLDEVWGTELVNGNVRGPNAYSGELLDIPGVHGHGIGLSETGQPVIRVFVTKEEGAKSRDLIPAELAGVPVEVQVTEPFVAF